MTNRIRYGLLCGILLVQGEVQGAINLLATRLIYPADATETSLMVRNDDGDPSLLQAWVDEGNANLGPDRSQAPFLVTPPVMRLGAGKGQALRIYRVANRALARDRESLFWLNVLGLPPRAKATGARVQVAYRTRIKLFYRPAGLAGSPRQAVARLVWRLEPGQGLRVRNDSPFHISVSEVLLEGGQGPQAWREAALIPPLGELRLPMAGLKGVSHGRLRWIDDDGNYHEQGFGLGGG
ncbi:fimbrial biogenesis chaperone [Aeromonas bivalvium]|uniref:fimbrial biogenesis chaperone n=1 Tax=Aeromonas bivalvium TaxID=440079 RepID=UPI0038D14020